MTAADAAGRRLVVVCGPGGVGKTTVSAAIALARAAAGARVAVITVDPARRLATALGIAHLGDEPQRVDAPGPAGQLWAMQLDPKATFDRLVRRHAPSAERAERILGNRVYRHLSQSVAGAQEYMAVERLHELAADPSWDAIVLDTPPARNALDLLDAPLRMARFIEGRALRLLLRPGAAGRLGWRALHAGSSLVLSLLERLTGPTLLHDVSDFLGAFDGMYAGFADRAREVRQLLASDSCAFTVVTAPEAGPATEAVSLWRQLARDGFPVAGLVVNRVRPLDRGGPVPQGAIVEALAGSGAADPAGLARRVTRAHEEHRRRALRDLDVIEGLRHALDDPRLVQLPELPRGPADVRTLTVLAAHLEG